MVPGDTLFLLSPANCGGRRAAALFRPEAGFDLAIRVRSPRGAPLGEVFTFVSGLYFRGKMAYARAFGRPPDGLPPALIITPSRGLVPPETAIGLPDLEEFASIAVDPADPRYAVPLLSDLDRVMAGLHPGSRVVLLGSLATNKYLGPLAPVLGDRLAVPEAFIGLGDMARGAMMLRAVATGTELSYTRWTAR